MAFLSEGVKSPCPGAFVRGGLKKRCPRGVKSSMGVKMSEGAKLLK